MFVVELKINFFFFETNSNHELNFEIKIEIECQIERIYIVKN